MYRNTTVMFRMICLQRGVCWGTITLVSMLFMSNLTLGATISMGFWNAGNATWCIFLWLPVNPDPWGLPVWPLWWENFSGRRSSGHSSSHPAHPAGSRAWSQLVVCSKGLRGIWRGENPFKDSSMLRHIWFYDTHFYLLAQFSFVS